MDDLINKIEKIFVYDKEKFNNIRNIFEKKEFKKNKDENKEYEIKFTQDEITIILNSLKYHKEQTAPKEKEVIKEEPEIIKEEKAFNVKMEFWKAKEKENEKEEKEEKEETPEEPKIKKKKKSKKDKEKGEEKKKKKKKRDKTSDE